MADVGGQVRTLTKGHRALFESINVLSLMEMRVAHLCEWTKNHRIGHFYWVDCISVKVATKRSVCICADTDKTC